MKLFRRMSRGIRDAFRSVFRNFSLSFASISCITITLIVVAISLVLSYNVENFTASIRKDVTMVVFLKSGTNEAKQADIERSIKATNNIAELDFKSKIDSANDAMKENAVFEAIMKEWNEETNPLLDSYMIKVKDIEKIKDTANTIKNLDGVNNVSYGEDIVDQLITVFKVIEKISVGMVVALILVTAFLITNTIKITIMSRKTEIEIMRLVGASNSAIKFPFVIEGLFLGMLGAVIPIIITVYGYVSLYNFFDGKLFNSSLAKLIAPTPFVYLTSLLLLVIGMLVGMFGSWRASRKYLKI